LFGFGLGGMRNGYPILPNNSGAATPAGKQTVDRVLMMMVKRRKRKEFVADIWPLI